MFNAAFRIKTGKVVFIVQFTSLFAVQSVLIIVSAALGQTSILSFQHPIPKV